MIYRDYDFRWYRPFLVLLGLEVVLIQNALTFVPIIESFTYKHLWSLLFTAIGFTSVVKTYYTYSTARKRSIISNGFSTDDIESDKVSEGLKSYAKSIVAHLIDTNTSKHSFALGITGEWGGGKTTFLDLLEKLLTGKAEIVKFNPWMCRTPEQVAEDFFVTLHRELSTKYSSLSRPIRDYAQFVSNATFTLGGGFLSKLTFALPKENLLMKKERLSDSLSRLEKPVVVHHCSWQCSFQEYSRRIFGGGQQVQAGKVDKLAIFSLPPNGEPKYQKDYES